MTTPTPAQVEQVEHPELPAGAERFTFGLAHDVAQLIESHGYEPFDGPAMVQLQQHLFHLLHGVERGDTRCYGGAR